MAARTLVAVSPPSQMGMPRRRRKEGAALARKMPWVQMMGRAWATEVNKSGVNLEEYLNTQFTPGIDDHDDMLVNPVIMYIMEREKREEKLERRSARARRGGCRRRPGGGRRRQKPAPGRRRRRVRSNASAGR